MKQPDRFDGLTLSSDDRRELRKRARGKRWTARVWKRMEMLRLLDLGTSVTATAEALGCYRREVSRVGKRYLASGLEYALAEEPRPGRAPKLDSTQEAALVAMVCGPAPEGAARWTVRLVAEQAVRRGITDSVGRDTVRLVLAHHGLKPWREKNVVRTQDRRRVRHSNGGPAAAVRS